MSLAVPARATPSRVARRTATRTWPAAPPGRAPGWAALGLRLTSERGSPYATNTFALRSRGTTSRQRFPLLGRDPLHRVGSHPPQSCRRTLALLPQAWIRWSEPSHLAAQAYFAFGFQLMGRATDSTRQNPRTSIYIPDLDLTFSVPSDLAAGGINAGQAEQMALSRAPVIVDPPWNGKPGHNQHGDPLPYAAAQSLTRGEFPEGYAVHHLGRVLPADEQPQPATPRASSRDPVHPLRNRDSAGVGGSHRSRPPSAR